MEDAKPSKVRVFLSQYKLLVIVASVGIVAVALATNPVAPAKLALLAFAQSVSFSVVSRARNRDNMNYHTIAAVFSNGVWFLTFRELVLANMNLALFIPYTAGTILGSVSGAKVSMWIEAWLGATSDSHVSGKKS